jgi:hypothetical protein
MKFEPRSIGASELFLLITQGASNETYFDKLIARFVEPPEDPTDYARKTCNIGTAQVIEQGGYRISFEGWSPPPIPITTPTFELPTDVTITDKATLRIENLSSHEIEYLYIQFLSNGETASQLIKE